MNWRRFLNRAKRYSQSADDIGCHLDIETEDNIRRGMTPNDARAAARRKFGNLQIVREEIYLMNRVGFVEALWSDARHTLRTIRRSPGPACVAVLTIALAIGVTTAIFSIVNAILLQSPPYKDPDRLVMLWNLNEKQGYTYADVTTRRGESMSPAEFLDWRRDSNIFSGLAAFNTTVQLITDTEQPQLIKGYALVEGSFQVLGIQPLIGRLPSAAEERPGAPGVLLLRYDFWRSRFQSDPSVIGKRMQLYGAEYRIVGVLPPGFIFFNREFEFLTVFPFDEEMTRVRSYRGLRVMGRLREGMTVQEAQARAQQFSQDMARKYPRSNADWHVRVVTVRQDTAGNLRPAMIVLLGALACILLIMCANIANLLLVQASARSREFAVRAALGASRWRLIRHVLSESLALSFAGGILGMAIAYVLTRYFQAMLPDRYFQGKWLVQVESIGVTWPVVSFGFGAALLTGIAVAIIPALRASRPDLNRDMNDAGRGSAGGRHGGRLRNYLVISEVAAGLVLVVGASLLVRSFVTLSERGAGLSGNGILTFQLTIPNNLLLREATPKELTGRNIGMFLEPRIRNLNDQLLTSLAAIPGVRAAAAASDLPMQGWFVRTEFSIEGGVPDPAGNAPLAVRRIVTPDFFAALQIPLQRGRFFNRLDRSDAAGVAIINNQIAERYFPNENPIGKHIRPGPADSQQPWLTIVGVVGSIREAGIDKAPVAAYYQSQTQNPLSTLYIVLKTGGAPMALMPDVRRAVRAVHKSIPIYSAREMSAIIRDSAWQLNYAMILMSGLGGLALLLAVIGLFGVLSHSVRERTREIGVRMALGAGARDVSWMVLRHGVVLVALGVGIGLIAASGLTRFLSAMLFGVGPVDLPTFGLAVVLLLAAGLTAGLFPAWRATHIEPVKALREQ
jgi:predicted permease